MATFPELDALRAARAARLAALADWQRRGHDRRGITAARRTLKALDAEIAALEGWIDHERGVSPRFA